MKPIRREAAPAWFSSAEELGRTYQNPLSGLPLDRRERARALGQEDPVEKQERLRRQREAGEKAKSKTEAEAAKRAEAGAANRAEVETEAKAETVSAAVEPGEDKLATRAEAKAPDAEGQDAQASDSFDNDTYLPLRDYCIRGRGVHCNRCQLACPMGAISFDQQGFPIIDQEACSRCGICSGICDGFSSTRITLQDLNNRILRMSSFADEVFITCDENIFEDMDPADNVMVLPCLAAMPPELYTLLLAQGINLTIACDFSYCANCRRAPGFGETLYTAAISMAETWTGRSVGIAPAPPERHQFLAQAVNEGASRRDLFDNLMGGINSVASGEYRRKTSKELQDFYAMQERMRASVAADLNADTSLNRYNSQLRKRLFPHRELLMEAAKVDRSLADAIEVPVSETDPDRCCQQLACLENCPTSARYADDFGNLCFDPSYCIGCSICVSACPNNACQVTTLALSQLGEPVTLGSRTAEDVARTASREPLVKQATDADDAEGES